MLKEELIKLSTEKNSPAISIIAPMKPLFPELKKNHIVVKNLLKEIREKLINQFTSRETDLYLKKIENLEKSISYDNVKNGIAIFVSNQTAKVIHLPFVPKKQAFVNSSFQVRDLVYTYNRLERYYVLCISSAPVRFFEGYGPDLLEIHDDTFPSQYGGPDVIDKFNPDTKTDIRNVSDDHLKNFFKLIDKQVFNKIKNYNYPLFLVGVTKNITFFKSHARSDRYVIDELDGNHVSIHVNELAKLIWPLVQKYKKKVRLKALKKLEESIGVNKYVSGLQSAWEMASNGSIDTLLVEEDYSVPAYLDNIKNRLFIELPKNSSNGLHRLEDAVDDIIEEVIKHNGNVIFLKTGRLKEHHKIAAITRY